MRAVLVAWSGSNITIRAIFDGPISAVDEETVSAIETEVLSHFPDHVVSARGELSPAARIEPAEGEVFVFLRA